MRVLFVNEYLPQEMLGPMYLSRAVKDAGHEMQAVCLPDPRWLAKIRAYEPDAPRQLHGVGLAKRNRARISRA